MIATDLIAPLVTSAYLGGFVTTGRVLVRMDRKDGMRTDWGVTIPVALFWPASVLIFVIIVALEWAMGDD